MDPKQKPIPMTAAGRAAMEGELTRLIEEVRPEIVQRIATTRDQGDLRENAGYHQAREDQSLAEGRIAEIEATLKAAVLIAEGSRNGIADIGSWVTVSDGGASTKYQIVGAAEVDVSAGRISVESPVGRALVGHRAGEEVSIDTPGGSRRIQITAVV